MSAFFTRLSTCHKQVWLAIDEFGCVLMRIPIYLITGKNCPDAHESISSWTGDEAAAGNWFAVHVAVPFINFGAWCLGGGKNHCARAAKNEAAYSTPVDA